MISNFFNYSKKILIADENYINSLIDFHRRYNPTKNTLVTGYFYKKVINIESSNINEKKTFFKLLQFLAFTRIQKSKTEIFYNKAYSLVQFKVTGFMNFIKIKNKNQY